MNEEQTSVQDLPVTRYEEVTHHIGNEGKLPTIIEEGA